MALNVAPTRTAHDTAYLRLANAEALADRPLGEIASRIRLFHPGRIQPTNLVNRLGINLVSSAQFSTLSWGTLLCSLISVVIGASAKKQMAGADARRSVAMMQHTQPGRDGAVGQLPRKSMRFQARSLPVPSDAVPIFVRGFGPNPTSRGLVRLRPKSFNQNTERVCFSRHLATSIAGVMRQAVPAVLPLSIVAGGAEW